MIFPDESGTETTFTIKGEDITGNAFPVIDERDASDTPIPNESDIGDSTHPAEEPGVEAALTGESGDDIVLMMPENDMPSRAEI